jgi:hypothetical protein
MNKAAPVALADIREYTARKMADLGRQYSARAA